MLTISPIKQGSKGREAGRSKESRDNEGMSEVYEAHDPEHGDDSNTTHEKQMRRKGQACR